MQLGAPEGAVNFSTLFQELSSVESKLLNLFNGLSKGEENLESQTPSTATKLPNIKAPQLD